MVLLGVCSLFPISSGGDGWTVARPDGLASPRTLDYPRVMSEQVRNLSIRVVRFSENAILLVIGFATLYAAGLEVMRLIQSAKVALGDLFLLFIYAEVIGMGLEVCARDLMAALIELSIGRACSGHGRAGGEHRGHFWLGLVERDGGSKHGVGCLRVGIGM